jgi:hypothetical protein
MKSGLLEFFNRDTFTSAMVQFRFPRCCSRCLAEGPMKSFEVETETLEQPAEGKTVIATYSTEVPVCDTCHARFLRVSFLNWVPGVIGSLAAAGLAIWFWPAILRNDANIPLALQVLVALGFIGGVAWAIARTLNQEYFNWRLVRYDSRQLRLVFGNKDYQALFDEANG